MACVILPTMGGQPCAKAHGGECLLEQLDLKVCGVPAVVSKNIQPHGAHEVALVLQVVQGGWK